jgi:hypothetical protein
LFSAHRPRSRELGVCFPAREGGARRVQADRRLRNEHFFCKQECPWEMRRGMGGLVSEQGRTGGKVKYVRGGGTMVQSSMQAVRRAEGWKKDDQGTRESWNSERRARRRHLSARVPSPGAPGTGGGGRPSRYPCDASSSYQLGRWQPTTRPSSRCDGGRDCQNGFGGTQGPSANPPVLREERLDARANEVDVDRPFGDDGKAKVA